MNRLNAIITVVTYALIMGVYFYWRAGWNKHYHPDLTRRERIVIPLVLFFLTLATVIVLLLL